MWLKFEILLGYIVLILLLVLTVYFFRREQMKRNTLGQEECKLVYVLSLAGETYAGLLELTTYGETVSVWDENDLKAYHTRRSEVCGTLQELKQYIHVNRQQMRIDSLCLLLERKEQLLDTVMNTFRHFQRIFEIVDRRILMIASQVHQDYVAQYLFPSPENKEKEKREKDLWSFF